MASSRDVNAVPAGLTVVPSVRSVDRALVGLRVKGRYRIVSELGVGPFGRVCLAEDETGDQEIAVRFLPRELVDLFQATRVRRRVGRPIAEAPLAHPALVRVLDFGEAENGQPFVAMELAHGRRLSDILTEGPLDVGVALRLAIDLGAAVETLHNMGQIHGALRPRNVMVGKEGRVKLMDVELAGLRDVQAMQGILADEPPAAYLAPEQIRQVLVTEAADIYAFAAIVYEMLCGRPPFQAKTRDALLSKHLAETPIRLRRRRRAVPTSVESVIALALSKAPEPRPPMQKIVNCLWQEAHHPATRWKRKAAIIGGAVAAAIAAAVGWVLLGPVPSPPPPPLARPAPADVPLLSKDPSPETRTAPTLGTVTPAAPPAAPATPPSAPAQASPPRRAERQEQRRVPQTPEGSASERPAASSNSDDPDPGAFIDWILEQRAAARRGR